MVWFIRGQTWGIRYPVEVARGGGGGARRLERYGVFSRDGGLIIKNNNNDDNNKIIVLNDSVNGSNNCAKVACERYIGVLLGSTGLHNFVDH